MLKQTVQYINFNDEPDSEVLYFNLTKIELSEEVGLQDRLESLKDKLVGEPRELTNDEKTEILDLVKTFVRISYGVKSADGKKHTKSDELWKEFTSTAVYAAFLWSLFSEGGGQKAVDFMLSILPADVANEIEGTMSRGRPATQDHQQKRAIQDVQLPREVELVQPAWLTEGRQPTDVEIREMTADQFAAWKLSQ